MKLSHKQIERGFHLRLMSPLGRYPADSFISESAALIVSAEFCFSVVRVSRRDWSFSEVDLLTAREIPLLGSFLFAGAPGTPYLFPYPTDYSVVVETERFENIEETNISKLKSFLLERIASNPSECPTSLFHLPLLLGGKPYEFNLNAKSDVDQHLLLRRLESAGPVICCGVSCLLRAQMAFQHAEFGEAACIFLWIALDAAHSLVLQKLRESGMANPTSKDAARYVDKISGHETECKKFFEEHYDNRIQSIHPENRYGAEAVPPLLADDFLDLYDLMIPLFYFFISTIPNSSKSEIATSGRLSD